MQSVVRRPADDSAVTTVDCIALVPGALLTPRIRLVERRAAGAMGTSWLAEHLGLQSRIIVKLMPSECRGDRALRRRFHREAALAARAKGPHVVQVLDSGVTPSGVAFIAMEHLDGEDLSALLRREGRVDPERFARWLLQIGRGLDRAHQRGIIHRDLEPSNLFLCAADDEVSVKILGFGVGTARGEDLGGTAPDELSGNPHYMSPEQRSAPADIDARSDLWSLGVIAYRAMVGKLPFASAPSGRLAYEIETLPHTPPSALVPELGIEIDAWMDRALAKSPARRFSSATEMAEALLPAAAGAHFIAPRSVAPRSVAPSSRSSTSLCVPRRPPQTALLARALLVLFLVATGLAALALSLTAHMGDEIPAARAAPPVAKRPSPASAMKPETIDVVSRFIPPPPPVPTYPINTAPLAPPAMAGASRVDESRTVPK